jgi:hypothetical protein
MHIWHIPIQTRTPLGRRPSGSSAGSSEQLFICDENEVNKSFNPIEGTNQSFFLLGGWGNSVVEPETLDDITLNA